MTPQEATLAPHPLHLLLWLLTGGMGETGGGQPMDFVDISLQGTEQGKAGWGVVSLRGNMDRSSAVNDTASRLHISSRKGGPYPVGRERTC